MNKLNVAFVGICLIVCLGSMTAAQKRSSAKTSKQKEKIVTKYAKGTFEVKIAPQTGDTVGDPIVGRLSLDKTFSGDIDGTSKGQMLAVQSGVEGSAGYVAMERVNGTLAGKKGSFALQHSGTMTRGAPSLTITVVPDSGTEELIGLTGKMTIKIENGKHFYEFQYSLPAAK